MSFDLETVMAYVDGELPPQRRVEVESAIAADPELAAMVEALYASQLPYHRAFAQQRVPPVPAALQARVEELAAVATASHDLALAGVAAGDRKVPGNTSAPNMIGMLLLLILGLLAGYLVATKLGSTSAPAAEPWVLKVSNYHAMYSRETVMDGDSGIAQTRALQRRLHQEHGLDLEIPDLTTQGLQFVRAQQLQFDGKMVLQLVYLPRQGMPLALCLTPATTQPERVVALDGLQALTWYSKGWAYVLVGALPLTEMQEVRRQLPANVI